MPITTLGNLSYRISPSEGQEFDLSVYVNHSSDVKTVEFSCRYTPVEKNNDINYFIASSYRIMEKSRELGGTGRYELTHSIMLDGSIKHRTAATVLRRVSNDIERVGDLMKGIVRKLEDDPDRFKDILTWHLCCLEQDAQNIGDAIKQRDFIVAIEIIALALLSARHPDPEVGVSGDKILDSLFLKA